MRQLTPLNPVMNLWAPEQRFVINTWRESAEQWLASGETLRFAEAPLPWSKNEALLHYLEPYFSTACVFFARGSEEENPGVDSMFQVDKETESSVLGWNLGKDQFCTISPAEFISRFLPGYIDGMREQESGEHDALSPLQHSGLLAWGAARVLGSRTLFKDVAIVSKMPIEFAVLPDDPAQATSTEAREAPQGQVLEMGMISVVAPNLYSSPADTQRYTTSIEPGSGVGFLKEDAFGRACRYLARLTCRAAKQSGCDELVMPELGLGIYLAALCEEEKGKARQLMIQNFAKAAQEFKLSVTWVIYDKSDAFRPAGILASTQSRIQEIVTGLACFRDGDTFKMRSVIGDIFDVARKIKIENPHKDVFIVNPSSDRTLGGQYISKDPKTLEEQLAQKTPLMFLHSWFNPYVQISVLQQLPPSVAAEILCQGRCSLDAFVDLELAQQQSIIEYVPLYESSAVQLLELLRGAHFESPEKRGQFLSYWWNASWNRLFRKLESSVWAYLTVEHGARASEPKKRYLQAFVKNLWDSCFLSLEKKVGLSLDFNAEKISVLEIKRRAEAFFDREKRSAIVNALDLGNFCGLRKSHTLGFVSRLEEQCSPQILKMQEAEAILGSDPLASEKGLVGKRFGHSVSCTGT